LLLGEARERRWLRYGSAVRAALRLFGNLVRISLWPLWLLSQRLLRPRARWVEVRLSAHPVEVAGPMPLWQRLRRRGGGGKLRSIVELRRLCALLADDPGIDGLLLHLPHLRVGWATSTSVRDALLSLRRSGKRVVAYLPQGGGNRELYVAWAADRVLVAPQAPVSLVGVSSQSLYLRPLLDRLGVRAEVHARGEYKTAAEPIVCDAMSEPQRDQLSALITGVQEALVQAAATRPGLDVARARALFERGVWGAQAAVDAGMVDAVCYEDELCAQLSAGSGQPRQPVRGARYLAWRGRRLWRRVRPVPAIAVVPVLGAIAHAGPAMPGSRVARQDGVVSALRRARKDRRVRAVLLHVDSPGGSALASDQIHRELIRLREKKPVVAYFGDVAASGGYYVAAPCLRIVAQPMTVTGSIGVVSVRFMLDALAQRLGLRPQTLRSAPHADMGSPFRPLDEAEHAMLWAETEAIYQAFVAVVAQGRGRPSEQVEQIARGRVWSGADAQSRGLVDELGGFDRALAALRELTPELRGLPEDRIALQVSKESDSVPPPAEPPSPAAWMSLIQHVPSEVWEVMHLFADGERALLYAAVPRFL
jgi:protease-4